MRAGEHERHDRWIDVWLTWMGHRHWIRRSLRGITFKHERYA